MTSLAAPLLAMWILLPMSPPPPTPQPSLETLQAIDRDIAALAGDYPQLVEFARTRQLNPGSLSIDYAYHTHRPQRHAGWTSGVPNPDDDGVWFTLDFHDPDSLAQIHTQPVVPLLCLGGKRVMLLILEGKKTRPVSGAIWSILRRHGASECADGPFGRGRSGGKAP